MRKIYIYQPHGWPEFTWDLERLFSLIGKVKMLQGSLSGRMESLGFLLKDEAVLQTLTTEVVKSSEIEGEKLDADQVRSSIARKLGMDIAGLVASDRNVDGVVEMMLDATQQYKKPLSKERLFDGIAHLWFVTIHPFDDGNGCIARAIADMQLARAEGNVQRFYSMSAQIRVLRKEYYTILEKTQQGNLDITPWLEWFLLCLKQALQQAEKLLEEVLAKAAFWQKHAKTIFNKRQQLLINKLLDQFIGNLSTSKWAKIAKCSQDTALRDIQDLMQKGVLQKEAGGGRSTSYRLIY